MTAPRPVFPGRFLFLTRATTQHEFLLRPDAEVNNAFTYCLGEASQRFDMPVVLSQMESNHHHTTVFDKHGRDVEFREHFHKMTAKCMNKYRDRWENFWAAEEPCVVEVLTAQDLLDKLVYTATNPVKDNLVEEVDEWPGPNFLQALLTGKPMKATRPTFYFSEHGEMPREVELVMKLPDDFEGKAEFLAELERRIAVEVKSCARERARTRKSVFGRCRVLRQAWNKRPAKEIEHRGLRPRVASRDVFRRIMKLQRNKGWAAEYRLARADWLAGIPTEFPFGTYWLKRFANVRVKPPPESI